MKKQIIISSIIAVVVLSSCTQTPDNIEGANHNVDLNSTNKVTVEHILDDFDEAFETKYTRFKLPDKSSVIINQPEGVYDLELKYVNDDKDTSWLKEKVYKLAKIFNLSNCGEAKKIGNDFTLKNNNARTDLEMFSSPYYDKNGDWNPNDIINKKIEYLDRINLEDLKDEYKIVVKKSVDYANEINEMLGGSLINNPMDLYIQEYNSEVFYALSLQPIYKGIGLQCITPTYIPSDIFDGDNALMTMSFYIKFLYDSKLTLYSYVGCNNYTPVKEEPIDKMISFKDACDILESELAENTNFEFDDVKLWYEPRGTIIDLSDSSVSTYDAHDGNKTIKCTPKWYFISDESSEADLHMINYITVDCVTGEIEVFFPE